MPTRLIEQMIRDVAKQFGLPPEYMLGKAFYESRLNPRAVSPTGAGGLFQFTKRTGRQYGLDRKSRLDPQRNTEAAAKLTKDNIAQFKKAFGREPTSREMYLMHQQGAAGAIKGIRRGDEPAVNVFGRKNVRVNLPRSERGRLNQITAREFQELHGKKIDKSMARFKDVDIGDEPQLASLQPEKPVDAPKKSAEAQILQQLAPTEEKQMPISYTEAIKQALTPNTENVEVVPAAMFPTIRGKGGRMARNPMNDNTSDPRIIKRLEYKQDRSKTPNADKQMEGSYGDYVRKEKQRMGINDGAEVHRNLPAVRSPDATAVRSTRTGAAQNDPEFASKYAERMKGGPLAKATTAAGAIGAGVYGDEALQAVYDTINNVTGNEPSKQTHPMAPEMQAQTPYNVDPSIAMVEQALGIPAGTLSDPNQQAAVTSMAGPGIRKALPAFQEAMADPETANAAMHVAKGVVSNIAKRDALEAATGAGTRRQFLLQQSAGQPNFEPGNPAFDRMMELAVSGDSQDVMRGNVPRGAQPPQMPRVARPTEVMPPQPQMPQETSAQNMQPMPQQMQYGPGSYPPGVGDPSMGLVAPAVANYMGYDPAMMSIYQFFAGGGEY